MDRYTGKVRIMTVARGSKSERTAVVLDTATGTFPLRRQAGNPLQDPELEKLDGKSIACTGQMLGTTLVIADWKEDAGGPDQ